MQIIYKHIYFYVLLLLMLKSTVLNQAMAYAGSIAKSEVSFDQQDIQVPFDFDPVRAPYIIVKLRINSSLSLPFIVDTGSSHSIALSEQTRRKLGVGVSSTQEKTNVNGVKVPVLEKVTVTWVTGRKHYPSIVVSPVEVSLPEITDKDGKLVVGIVGMPLLCKGEFIVDFDKKIMILEPKKQLVRSNVVARIPMIKDTSGRYSVTIYTDTETKLKAMIDTGRYYSVLDSDLVGTPEGSEATPVVERFERFMTAKKYTEMLYLFRKVKLVGNKEGRKLLLTEDYFPVLLPSEYPNLLGLSLLSRYNLFFDFKQSQITFLQRQKSNAQVPGSVGLEIDTSETNNTSNPSWRIGKVFRGEPAAKAGLRVGDQIMLANGILLSKDHSVAQKQLDGFANTILDLQVRRSDNSMIAVKVVRQINSLGKVSSFLDWNCEFNWNRKSNGVLISHIGKSGIAFRSGLKAGDKLLSINNISLDELSWRGIIDEMQRIAHKTVSIRLERDGTVATVSATRNMLDEGLPEDN